MSKQTLNLIVISLLLLAIPLFAQSEQEKSLSDQFGEMSANEQAVDDEVENFQAILEAEGQGDIDNLSEKIEAEYQNMGSKGEEEQPQQLTEEQSEKISQFFEEAAKNYEEILNNRPQAEVRTTSKRIDSNQQLLEENSSKLTESQNDLRKLKLEYIRRFLILKNAYKRKSLSKKLYEKELEKLAKQYEYRVRSLTEDVSFYEGEVSKTSERLNALSELNRINKIVSQQHGGKPQPKKNKKPMTELEKMIHRLQSVGCFDVDDAWKSSDIK